MRNYNLPILIVMLACFVLFALSELEYVNSQQSVNLTKVIEEKFPPITISEYSPFPFNRVEVEYVGPTTILISGPLIHAAFNSDLWAAMDLLKNQYGFKIQQVMTSGVGSVGNPTTVYILMTK
jgi:hypothetical protein